ncbi:hypothetical protein LTR78_002938 [Recurvomyces mirabilis]|uniref:DUF7908 domain-containing protein n=1 Tax=Recurvomyces mirabilis TaxID=574656 RepID=A0AAE0WSS0_9PEZI|nr:hypothetical protein LTR78_002938 [Recurvomyces mirabilis]KAK5159328.1 hypothetical protein LTS14_002470 [Recurvomyces mirabilis]
MANGNTTTDIQEAVRYEVQNGQLTSTTGGYVSTAPGIESLPFALTSAPEVISINFTVTNGVLVWSNAVFTDGKATLYKTPTDLVDNAQIIARLSGPTSNDWAAVALMAMPVSGPVTANASQSTSMASVVSIGPASTSAVTSQSSLGSQTAQSNTGGPAPSSTGTFYSAMSSSLSVSQTTSSAVVSGSITMTSATTSSQSAIPTYACPANNDSTVGDLEGIQYTIGCGQATTGDTFASTTVSRSFNECFGLCDQLPGCLAVYYDGGSNGVGAGTCWFNNQPASFLRDDKLQYFVCNGSFYSLIDFHLNKHDLQSYVSPCGEHYVSFVSYVSLQRPIYVEFFLDSNFNFKSVRQQRDHFDIHDQFYILLNNFYQPWNKYLFHEYSSRIELLADKQLKPDQYHVGDINVQRYVELFTKLKHSEIIYDQQLKQHVLICILDFIKRKQCQLANLDYVKLKQCCFIYEYILGFHLQYFKHPQPTKYDEYELRLNLFKYLVCDKQSFFPDELIFGKLRRLLIGLFEHSLIYQQHFVSKFDKHIIKYRFYLIKHVHAKYTDIYAYIHLTQAGNPCYSWTWASGALTNTYGVGSGTCYFKNFQTASFTTVASGNNAANYVGAIMAAHYDPNGDTYPPGIIHTSSSTSSAQKTTTTTTTTPTSSSSSTSNPAITSMSSSSSSSSSSSTTSTSSSTSTRSTQYLVLPSPTPCDFGDPQGTDEDDSFCDIPLSFPLQIYSKSDTTIHASTNGYISILTGSSQYQTSPLPNSHIPNNTVLPYASDMYLYGSAYPPQGIFYQASSSNITLEYYLGRYQGSGMYHFTVAYNTSAPGVFVYTYYTVGGSTDDGVMGVVGAQGGE